MSQFVRSFGHPRIVQNVYIVNYSVMKLLLRLSWFHFLSRIDLILGEKYPFSIYVRE